MEKIQYAPGKLVPEDLGIDTKFRNKEFETTIQSAREEIAKMKRLDRELKVTLGEDDCLYKEVHEELRKDIQNEEKLKQTLLEMMENRWQMLPLLTFYKKIFQK